MVDVPNVVDAEGQYRCEACGGVFDTDWSDGEALDEASALWPEAAGVWAVVCDDCFNLVVGAKH